MTAAPNASGKTTITVTVSDGEVDVETSFAVTVEAVNDAPGLAAPTAVELDEDTSATIPGVSAWDSDAGNQKLSVSIMAASGTLLVTETQGIEFVSRSADNGDFIFTGTLTAVNKALATLSYQGECLVSTDRSRARGHTSSSLPEESCQSDLPRSSVSEISRPLRAACRRFTAAAPYLHERRDHR